MATTTNRLQTEEVTVYGHSTCEQCKATVRYLEQLGIDYTYVDISEDPKAHDELFQRGYRQVPVVIAGDRSWTGYRREEIVKCLAAA